jgi:hypothetical protein
MRHPDERDNYLDAHRRKGPSENGSPHWTISATGSSGRPRKSACSGHVRQGFASGEACGSEKASGRLAPANSSNAASNRPVGHVLVRSRRRTRCPQKDITGFREQIVRLLVGRVTAT